MLKKLIPPLILAAVSVSALAADVTYRKDIAPMFKEGCSECHGASAPQYKEFNLDEKKFTKEKTGPRMNSYDDVIYYVGWPDTGAMMRRLDDGKSVKDGKPGNMYRYLGADDAERQKNLAIVKTWVGEGAWNLNRWTARGDVPAITREQFDKLKLKY